jgi:hypothetical protein
MTRKKQNPRRLRSVLGAATIASFVAAALFTPNAAYADIIGSYTLDKTTVEQGGTVTFTLSLSYYGFNTTDGDIAYFCGETQSSDTSDTSDPGWSATLSLVGANGAITTPNSIVSGTSSADFLFDGPGVGNFSPGDYPVTDPRTFTFTIPSTVPAGDYQVMLGCVSPANLAVQISPNWWSSPILPLTVTAPGAPSSPETLPATGLNDGATGVGIVATIGFVVLGIAGVLIRRRRSQNLPHTS